MKGKVLLIVLVMILAAPSIGAAAAPAGGDTSAGASVPGSVLGMGRELGLLVLGIGWEAVRIVLPESCPAKHKDIDRLIHSEPDTTSLSPHDTSQQ
jgi:hypothetical protein